MELKIPEKQWEEGQVLTDPTEEGHAPAHMDPHLTLHSSLTDDHSRVMLKAENSCSQSDYINASPIVSAWVRSTRRPPGPAQLHRQGLGPLPCMLPLVLAPDAIPQVRCSPVCSLYVPPSVPGQAWFGVVKAERYQGAKWGPPECPGSLLQHIRSFRGGHGTIHIACAVWRYSPLPHSA